MLVFHFYLRVFSNLLHVERLRGELSASAVVEIIYVRTVFQVPLASHLASLALCPYLVWLSPSCRECASFSQDGVQLLRVSMRLPGHMTPLPSLTPWGTFLCMCSLGDLLDLKSEKICSRLLSFTQSGLSSSLFLPLFLSWTLLSLRGKFQPVASLVLCRWKRPWRIFFSYTVFVQICS